MTSKEILTKLFDRCLPCMMSLTADQENQIIRDLEVLEHLKNLFNGIKVLENMGITYKDMYLLCKNCDDNLIKEWLKEEEWGQYE